MTHDIDDPKTRSGVSAPAAEIAIPPEQAPEASGTEGPEPRLAAGERAEPEPEPEHKHRRGKDKESSAERDLIEARRESVTLRDRYLRAAAEMDNLRKRMEREKAEYFQFALADLLKELLSVLDNFERALQSAPGTDPAGFQEGVGLIHKQLTDLLRRRGVTPIEAADTAFDPSIQQAIVTEASAEVEEPKVAEELQRGYRLNDRLLRPALVKVLVPGKD